MMDFKEVKSLSKSSPDVFTSSLRLLTSPNPNTPPMTITPTTSSSSGPMTNNPTTSSVSSLISSSSCLPSASATSQSQSLSSSPSPNTSNARNHQPVFNSVSTNYAGLFGNQTSSGNGSDTINTSLINIQQHLSSFNAAAAAAAASFSLDLSAAVSSANTVSFVFAGVYNLYFNNFFINLEEWFACRSQYGSFQAD